MEISVPDGGADVLADLWVALAESQREHGSHILPDPNRPRIRQAISHHLVQDRVLVAREGDAILGFVMFTIENPTFEQDVSKGLIENIYVVPERRSEGIGAALLAAAEEALADVGVDVVALEVMGDNESARRFYGAAGYTERRVSLEKSLGTDTPSRGDE